MQRRILETVLILVAVVVPIYLVGTRNLFFARLWQYWRRPEANLQEYLSYLGFDARLIYGQAAFNAYLAYPVLGVGLGNYAFYFDRMLPDRDYSRQPEIIRQLTPTEDRARLVTPKNLYARILAETGLLGVITFTAFLVAALGCALFLWFSFGSQEKFWGGAGLLAIAAMMPRTVTEIITMISAIPA